MHTCSVHTKSWVEDATKQMHEERDGCMWQARSSATKDMLRMKVNTGRFSRYGERMLGCTVKICDKESSMVGVQCMCVCVCVCVCAV